MATLKGKMMSFEDLAPEIGKKDDTGKVDYSLIPKVFLDSVARAFMHGEKKYGRWNYTNGLDWHRLTRAAIGHILDFNEGKDIDEDSKNEALGNAAASIAMLMVHVAEGLGTDTRRKK